MKILIDDEEVIAALTVQYPFSTLTHEQQVTLVRQGECIVLERGHILHTPYEICDRVFLIMSGEISISFALPSGNRALLRSVSAGETFGEIASQMHQCYPGWIESRKSGIAFTIPYDAIFSACSQPAFLQAYLYGVSRRMQQLITRYQIISCKTIDRKLASYLLQKYAVDNSSKILFTSVSVLASYLGNSRESVSRKLSEFKSLGLITQEEEYIIINDPYRLEDILVR